MLKEYTTEELIYEYYLLNEHKQYQQEMNEQATDKIEEMREKEAAEWADQMEAEEAEIENAKLNKSTAPEKPKEAEQVYDPMKDPANLEWMEKEMRDAKLFFGDDFGEDVSLSFGDPNEGK